ncbi:MAG: ornithine cyclodeaminase family protein [Deltaproteobacteria bacterium]|nr:ornithine cyclodeaminase family protein [Deltaproteobacteria bacterium]
MTLILTNQEIESIFTLDECFAVLEPALMALGNGRAVNMPRQDLLVPGALADSYHGLKTSCASLPDAGVTTLRVTSDVLTWPVVGGRQRRVKVPLAQGDKYVGLVLVFSIASGELLGIFPDGFMQAIRVGVTNALSAKYLARKNSRIMALYGSGWQARPALLAMCKTLPIEEVRVYSPTKANRESFVGEMRRQTTAKLIAVGSPEQAAENADVVSLTTNALDPFFPAAWMEAGMHITTIRPSEMMLDALVRCDLIAVSTREAAKLFTLPGEEQKVPEFGKGDYGRAELENTAADWRNKPELSEIMASKIAGRKSAADITCMLNHLGLGLQFSACAARILILARERKLGRQLPAEWFCQEEHS